MNHSCVGSVAEVILKGRLGFLQILEIGHHGKQGLLCFWVTTKKLFYNTGADPAENGSCNLLHWVSAILGMF